MEKRACGCYENELCEIDMAEIEASVKAHRGPKRIVAYGDGFELVQVMANGVTVVAHLGIFATYAEAEAEERRIAECS